MTVTVETAHDPPDFIAYRDGTSSWRSPQPHTGGAYAAHHYELDVTSEYEVVAVWIDPTFGTAFASELRATTDDGTRWLLGGSATDLDTADIETSYPSTQGDCVSPDAPSSISGSVIASGTMAQAGQISIGGECTASGSGLSSWSYRLSVLPGVHDVIATDPMWATSPHVAITRSLTIDADRTMPTIDLAVDGQPLEATTITVTNTGAAGDAIPLTNQLDLLTATSAATLGMGDDRGTSASHVVWIAPPSLLERTDTQRLTISVSDPSNALRQAVTTHPAETSVFELLSVPTVFYFPGGAVDTAHWGELDVRAEAVDFSTVSSLNAAGETITATARWLDRHGTSLAFDTDVPGFDVGWAVDITRPHTNQFTVRARDGNVDYASVRP